MEIHEEMGPARWSLPALDVVNGVAHHDFSQALNLARRGKRMARKGWEKGRFVFMGTICAINSPVHSVRQPTDTLMSCSSQKVLSTWLPSMGDLLAGDWVIYKEPQASGLSEQQQLALEELEQINEKLESLANFINDPGSTFTSLSWEEQHQLRMKAAYQADYARALKRIIDGLGGEGRGGTE